MVIETLTVQVQNIIHLLISSKKIIFYMCPLKPFLSLIQVRRRNQTAERRFTESAKTCWYREV